MSGTYVDSLDNVTRIVVVPAYRRLSARRARRVCRKREEFADYNHTRNVYLLMAGFISLAMLSFFAVATGLIEQICSAASAK